MSALSPRQMFLLDSACVPLLEAFGWSTYLVGTAVQPRDGKPPRDIDVRTIMGDNPTLVYITRSNLYGRLYAHGYPRGTLYRVEPIGELVASPDPEQTESAGVARARIVAIVDPVVRLRPTDLRRLQRMARS